MLHVAGDEKINSKETKAKTAKGRSRNCSHSVLNSSCIRLTQSTKQSSTVCNFQKTLKANKPRKVKSKNVGQDFQGKQQKREE